MHSLQYQHGTGMENVLRHFLQSQQMQFPQPVTQAPHLQQLQQHVQQLQQQPPPPPLPQSQPHPQHPQQPPLGVAPWHGPQHAGMMAPSLLPPATAEAAQVLGGGMEAPAKRAKYTTTPKPEQTTTPDTGSATAHTPQAPSSVVSMAGAATTQSRQGKKPYVYCVRIKAYISVLYDAQLARAKKRPETQRQGRDVDDDDDEDDDKQQRHQHQQQQHGQQQEFHYHEADVAAFMSLAATDKFCGQYTKRYASLHPHDDMIHEHKVWDEGDAGDAGASQRGKDDDDDDDNDNDNDNDDDNDDGKKRDDNDHNDDNGGGDGEEASSSGARPAQLHVSTARVLLKGKTRLLLTVKRRALDIIPMSGTVLFFAQGLVAPVKIVRPSDLADTFITDEQQRQITRWDFGVHRSLVVAHTSIAAFLAQHEHFSHVLLPRDMGRHGLSVMETDVRVGGDDADGGGGEEKQDRGEDHVLCLKLIKLGVRVAPRGKAAELRYYTWAKEEDTRTGVTIKCEVLGSERTHSRANARLESRVASRYQQWRTVSSNTDDRECLHVVLARRNRRVTMWIRPLSR
ncbi:hypothetical protein PTSG_07881 [Salpingoeca rosetta]|uniref:Uncharacterized protein n=1 Tax=Salpingoeca rosetta (strain ATCC 50818 / BSB-021) TaxID=946362 RepID=F2UGL3_SALR5|nr:uncharacterized protein PTSG_07881 [Salpingoeca rosetta]EGD75763.1 hypothetical protein PTSG_07881 [Salpingoeca rosetta]|eukprot:XP_004991684.1 hypothetical protein PTSG_07881 [Salpingoeca rosetta]